MTTNRLRDLRYQAPEDLKADLKSMLKPSKRSTSIFDFVHGKWVGPAIGFAAMVCLVFWMNFSKTVKSDQLVLRDVTNSHIRSLMVEHIYDVASTDQHTVKPWFTGKLDFAPKVVDLKSVGFPLVGGRLDYIGGRSTAAIVYQRDRHIINLFCWPGPSGDSEDPQSSMVQGYNIWHWSMAGMQFYAISDLNAKDLRFFVDKLRE